MYRRQIEPIIKDLQKKLVFIVGPRQVGKTWLATEIGKRFSNTAYLNYDSFDDRQIIEDQAWLGSTDLLILDELHKMPNWKNYLKGVFDTKPGGLKILVTGSARLDTFRQAGDSLAGRFFTHRLLPFSAAELKDDPLGDDLDRFIARGGFPEPFLAESDVDAGRWRNHYIDGLVRIDVLDFQQINDFKAIQMVFELLRRRVGSPVSFTSIAGDVNISPTTVIKYVEILEALFIVFKVPPYARNIARSVLKEPKIYFFDNGLVVGDEGSQLENFVAVSLLKHALAKQDYEAESCQLRYLRTKDGKEVDFCLTQDDEAIEAIEVKSRDGNLSKNLKYFCDKYQLKGTQLVRDLRRERMAGKIEIRQAHSYLKQLNL